MVVAEVVAGVDKVVVVEGDKVAAAAVGGSQGHLEVEDNWTGDILVEVEDS